MYYIYCYTNKLNNHKYVGQTNNYERRIREQKDVQILAKSSGDKELTLQAQTKITQLTTKYKQLCNASGLPNQLKTRASVVGYKRINVAKM